MCFPAAGPPLLFRQPKEILGSRCKNFTFLAIEFLQSLAAPADAVCRDGIDFDGGFEVTPIVNFRPWTLAERTGQEAGGCSNPLRSLPLAFGPDERPVRGQLRRYIHPLGMENISIYRGSEFFAGGLRNPDVL